MCDSGAQVARRASSGSQSLAQPPLGPQQPRRQAGPAYNRGSLTTSGAQDPNFYLVPLVRT